MEERILRAKRSALSVATRVLTHAGKGHAYWQHFENETSRNRVPKLGAEIYDLLFKPTLATPIKTTEVPLAGEGYGAGVLRLAFDLIALANNLPIPDLTRTKSGELLPNDAKGTITIKYLQETKKLIQLILSNDASSFGLHPALYFYTGRGAFQPAALLNVAAWLIDLKHHNKLDDFRKVRGAFEDLMLAHPIIIKPPTNKLGSGKRTRPRMVALLHRALEIISQNPNITKAWVELKDEFPHLAREEEELNEDKHAGKPGGRFSSATKSAASLIDISIVPKCCLCGGLKHPHGITLDHDVKKADGGTSAITNSRWVHPICNSNRDKDKHAKATT